MRQALYFQDIEMKKYASVLKACEFTFECTFIADRNNKITEM